MQFDKTFDELLDAMLTDWRNQFPEADTSQGSLIFVKSACLASALWGIYKYQDYIARQIFPDTADSEHLERHAFVRGLDRKVGETDADLLARLLAYIRRPPAGGNRYDYEKWALEIQGVKAAYCIPLALGIGTVDVIIAADPATTGSIIPTQELLDQVRAHIDDLRPVTAGSIRILPPEVLTIAVSLTATGSGANKAQIAVDITAYLESLPPGNPLYLAQLVNLAVINGAENAVVTAPAATVTPLHYQLIRPGVISVT